MKALVTEPSAPVQPAGEPQAAETPPDYGFWWMYVPLRFDDFAVVTANNLVYTLDAGAPAGAAIARRSGKFTWTPTTGQAGVQARHLIGGPRGLIADRSVVAKRRWRNRRLARADDGCSQPEGRCRSQPASASPGHDRAESERRAVRGGPFSGGFHRRAREDREGFPARLRESSHQPWADTMSAI